MRFTLFASLVSATRRSTTNALQCHSRMKPNLHCPQFSALGLASILTLAGAGQPLCAAPAPLLNDPVDISPDFQDFANTLFLADKLVSFDAATATGKLSYKRSALVTKHAFDNTLSGAKAVEQNEFPAIEYAANPEQPFSVEFVTPRTVRLRISSGPQFHKSADSLMLAGPVAKDSSWKYSAVKGGHRYTSAAGSVTVLENPWHVEVRDASGTLLTKTDHSEDNKTSFTPILPFSYVRRGADYSRSFNAVFTLSPGEQIFGCGETFMGLDKRGQKGRALDRRRQRRAERDDVQARAVFPEQPRLRHVHSHHHAHHLRFWQDVQRHQFADDRRRRTRSPSSSSANPSRCSTNTPSSPANRRCRPRGRSVCG
jgi:hypothetical protein